MDSAKTVSLPLQWRGQGVHFRVHTVIFAQFTLEATCLHANFQIYEGDLGCAGIMSEVNWGQAESLVEIEHFNMVSLWHQMILYHRSKICNKGIILNIVQCI